MASSVIKKLFNRGMIYFFGSGTQHVDIKAPANVASYQLELPATSGSLNQILKRTHSGLEWATDPGIAVDLDTAYDNGRTVDVDSGAVEFDAGTSDALNLKGKLNVTNTIHASGDLDVDGSLDVDGTTNLSATNIDGTLKSLGAANVAGTLTASGVFIAEKTITAASGITTSQTMYGLNIRTANSPWIDVKHPTYGAVGDGVTDDTDAFNNAITAANAANLEVFIPAGIYNLNRTINLKNNVRIHGAGIRGTFLRLYDTIGILGSGVQYSSLHSMTLGLQPTVSQGLKLINKGGTSVSYNSFDEIEFWAPSLIANQVGLHISSDVSGDATFNKFHNLFFYGVTAPIYSNDAEANFYSDVDIQVFGSGTTGIAIENYSHAEQYSNIHIGGVGNATTNYGIAGTPQNCIFQAIGDFGTGSLFNITGEGVNIVTGKVLGDTLYGTPGYTRTPLGWKRDTVDSGYIVHIIAPTGLDRDLFHTGISNVSNGFTVQYIQSTQRMEYVFSGPGDFYLGATLIATGAGTPENNLVAPVGSLYLRTDGDANTTLYVKTSGTGAAGWSAK